LDEKKMMMMNGMKEKVWSIGHGWKPRHT
jgi:hypothetical protein